MAFSIALSMFAESSGDIFSFFIFTSDCLHAKKAD